MHRRIHELWGFGQIEVWDEQPATSPVNDRRLMTNVEIVLNADGTVDHTAFVQRSGYAPYDVAVFDVVYSAGPYPPPPATLHSADGKVYLHWRFYRDDRQCAPDGVDLYILPLAGPVDNRDGGADTIAGRG
jgi:hypothetical protein